MEGQFLHCLEFPTCLATTWIIGSGELKLSEELCTARLPGEGVYLSFGMQNGHTVHFDDHRKAELFRMDNERFIAGEYCCKTKEQFESHRKKVEQEEQNAQKNWLPQKGCVCTNCVTYEGLLLTPPAKGKYMLVVLFAMGFYAHGCLTVTPYACAMQPALTQVSPATNTS